MAAKDECSMTEMTPRKKKDFLKDCIQKHKELSKFQREYKKILSVRFMKRSERILEKSYLQTIESLQRERNDLRAQIYVANGCPHSNEDKRRLEQIQCHVECQERLSDQIKNLKVAIRNLEYQKALTDKEIYELNRKTVPDSQHQTHVEHARKKLSIFENRMEVGIRHECKFTAMNSAMREEIRTMLNQRNRFNAIYTTLVQRLNADKKYLIDLLEYATNAFEGGIEVNEKMANARRKSLKESEQTKVTVQSVMRNLAAAELVNGFLSCKNYTRPMADLQPVEYRRRENYKHNHVHKITLYNQVLNKILDYSSTQNVHAVIEKYQQQESLYYTYFTYANETSYHITFLETAVDRLFTSVKRTKIRNQERKLKEEENIDDLDDKLQQWQRKNRDLNSQLVGKEKNLEELFQGFKSIFDECHADGSPLMALLGNQSFIDVFNLSNHLKILEKRILDIVHSVYVKERVDSNKNFVDYVVTNIEKVCETPTDLDDIVLTQQCPECAEGETFNIDDGGDAGIAVTSIAETKIKLSEAVNQPDMQYRLHSISHCRLPRSRLLASKKHI